MGRICRSHQLTKRNKPMPVFDFDVSTYEAPKRTSFEPLPPGDYNAMISDSQMA